MTPLVSIIIPVYNGWNYLSQAIDSALAQTYGNIEVVVVNDGSADDGMTETIAQSYGDRIRYLAKANGGVATALNAGIKAARGDYISWLSHDDLYHSDKVARQMAFLATIPDAEKVIVYSDYEAIDANNAPIRTVRLPVVAAADPRQAIIMLLFASSVHGCTLLLPKRCFNDVGYFDESLRTTQDYDLWFRLLQNGYEFRHLPEPLICARWHEGQGTRSLYKLAHREIEALYIAAVDSFYGDLERFRVQTLMELIVDLRERKLGKTAHHLLRSIKTRNRVLYQQLYDQYAERLIKSQLKLMTAKPLEIATAIIRRLGLRGRA